MVTERTKMDATTIANYSWVFVILMLWSIPWKAIALWKSARRKDMVWFIILMLVNTVGILEIIYIFLISKNKKEA